MLLILFLFLLPYQLLQTPVYVEPLEQRTDFLLHNSYPLAGVPESSRLCWGDGGVEIPLLDGSTLCKWI
jgi:hypothetical protein